MLKICKECKMQFWPSLENNTDNTCVSCTSNLEKRAKERRWVAFITTSNEFDGNTHTIGRHLNIIAEYDSDMTTILGEILDGYAQAREDVVEVHLRRVL